MPCHNAGRWIRQALESIESQTFPAHEVIVIDDSSTDDSLEQIQASGVSVKLLHTQHHNAASARNEGVQHAMGDWLAFLDADDMWYAHHLQQFIDFMNGSDDVAYVAIHDLLHSDDGLVSKSQNPWPITQPTHGLSHRKYIEMWRIEVRFNPVTILVRTDRFREIGGFDSSQVRRHDFDMWLRVIHNRTWSYNPVVAAAYRTYTPNSISRVDWANSEYYHLRGMVKNIPAYEDCGLHCIIQDVARRAMSASFTDGTVEDQRKARQLAWPYLLLKHKVLFNLVRFCPSLFRTANRLRRRLVMPRKRR